MPRKSSASLEDQEFRDQLPRKVAKLVEQLFTEQCSPVLAASTLRCKLLEIRVNELEQRLNTLDPQPAAPAPSGPWPAEDDEMSRTPEFGEEFLDDSWEDLDDGDEDKDQDQVPF